MKKYVFLILLFFFKVRGAETRETLQAWQRVAAAEEELIKSDNTSIEDPDFLSFYQRKDPSFFGLILVRLRLAEPLWDPLRLGSKLLEMTKKRSIKKQNRTVELVVTQGARVFVVGNLHGGFHSAVRDLTQAKALGLINERLQVTAPNTYLVFLGDIINGTPYSLLLLEFIMTLMEKNPERVFYVRGHQETDGAWAHYSSVRTQLKRWGYFWYRGKGMPLEKELNGFFDTLPDLLLIRHKEAPFQVIGLGITSSQGLYKKDDDVQAFIFGEELLRPPFRVRALEFCRFEKGIAAWSLLSSPTPSYQEFLKFYDDSFAVLEIGKNLRDSLIVSYSQDVRNKRGFNKEVYVASLGLRVDQDVPDREYPTHHIFSMGHLTGNSVLLGRATYKGIEAAIKRTNRAGGVKGLYLKPYVLDDQYIPHLTRGYVDMLVDQLKVDTVLCPSGSKTLASYMDRVERGELNVFFPITGGPQFRKPELTHLIHFRPNYAAEVDILVEHLTHEYASKNFLLMYENDAYGVPLVKAVHESLEKRGIKTWVDVPFASDQTTLDVEVQKVINADPEAIGLFFSSTTLARNFLIKLGIPFLLGKHLFSNGFLMDESFRRFMENTGLMVTFSFIVPNPWESSLELVKEYREDIKMDEDIIDLNSLESYMATSFFIEGLRHVDVPFKGVDIRTFIEGMRNYNFKGLSLSFDPKIRGFRLPIWICNEEGKWIAYEQRQEG